MIERVIMSLALEQKWAQGRRENMKQAVVVTISMFLFLMLSGYTIAGDYHLPDTGIDKCYDNDSEITCPSPGQPFYGQDAQYDGPQPTYRDNGDGTVADLNTGLMWQQSTTYYFHYGTRTNYGLTTTSTSAGSGKSNVSASVSLTALSSNTTYHYRVVATNSVGTSSGNDQTFTTLFGRPSSIAPIGGQEVTTDVVDFTWSAVAGATGYQINVRGDSSIGKAVGYLWVNSSGTSFSYDMSFIIVTFPVTLYWGVRAKGSEGNWGEWCDAAYFIYDPSTPMTSVKVYAKTTWNILVSI